MQKIYKHSPVVAAMVASLPALNRRDNLLAIGFDGGKGDE